MMTKKVADVSRLYLFFALIFGCVQPVVAQDLSALARVNNQQSDLHDDGLTVNLALSISQPVPYRIFTLDSPRRLVIDFNEVDWESFDPVKFDNSEIVTSVRVGIFVPGWSRMVLQIDQPLQVDLAGLSTNAAANALVNIRLSQTTATEFAASAGAPVAARGPVIDQNQEILSHRQNGQDPLVVVLDPGHGGIDPGAQSEGTIEADLMLAFAFELRETLLRTGEFKVHLTRDADHFVSLERRISIARAASADVFLSLHADALVEGRASGATIYTLSQSASDTATRKLAERHDRGDLLSGVDLSQQDDVIATVLMDMARTETAPRSDKLAKSLVAGLSETVGVHKRPHLSAGFSVLKSPDVPSVLVELGFLSSKRDRARLTDDAWRTKAANGIRNALISWRTEDAADAAKIRK